MKKEKNLQNLSFEEIEKMDVPIHHKNILLEMNELYWKYANQTPDSKGFDFKTAEGIKMCIDILKKNSI
jgi:hypothetical protein